jgi:hypothetical protein
VDQVHEFVDRAGVAGPRFDHGLHSGRWPGLIGACPSDRSGPRRLAARVATARRRRTGDEASAPSGHGTGTVEEGRKRGEGVRGSTGVRVPFYRVGREAGAAGNGGRWR